MGMCVCTFLVAWNWNHESESILEEYGDGNRVAKDVNGAKQWTL